MLSFALSLLAWLLIALALYVLFTFGVRAVTRKLPGEVDDLILSAARKPLLILVLLRDFSRRAMPDASLCSQRIHKIHPHEETSRDARTTYRFLRGSSAPGAQTSTPTRLVGRTFAIGCAVFFAELATQTHKR
jgi:hypothetical protein